MTLPDNPLAAVQQLLSCLLQGQYDKKGVSDRLKIKIIRELRTRLLSENFRSMLLHRESNSVTSQSQKSSKLEDVSWGNIIRDLVDIIDSNCTLTSSSKEKNPSAQKELADTLLAVVRVSLEDMWGTNGEGRIFNSLFNDFILNALRFAFTSLRDIHRVDIHSNMWCLARDILAHATVLQHLGKRQLAKWYELCFELFQFIETVDITFRRMQLTAARQIVVMLIQTGELFELADETLLRRLIKTTIQFLQSVHSYSVTDDDGASFGISCLFHILCRRGLELDSETLHHIDNMATYVSMSLLSERKWHAGVVGYLVIISSLLRTPKCSTKEAIYMITEYPRQQFSNCSEEIIEYLSHLLSLSELLSLWQKQELSPDYITYLLTFKLQSLSIVRRELNEQLELFNTLCSLFETTYTSEPSYRGREECKRDVFFCCFHMVQLISLHSTIFHLSYAYKFFHLSARYFTPTNSEISTMFVLTCCFFLHGLFNSPRGLGSIYYFDLDMAAMKILSANDIVIEKNLLVCAISHFTCYFGSSFLRKVMKGNFTKFLTTLNELDYLFLSQFVELTVMIISGKFFLKLPKLLNHCSYCTSCYSNKSDFSILMDRMECRNDSIEVVTRSFPQREHFWSQLFSIQKPFRKEGTKFSEKAVASSLTVFVAELDKLISTRRSAYVNVKLSYFFAELLRQVTCNLENAMNLSSLKETAQNFFLEILASFESVVSVISTNENDLWDIAVFAKSIATVLSIDHSLSWSLELKERAKSVLQQCLQISADFSGSLEDAEICSRAELTHTSKKRRISLTKPVAYFQEKTVNREFVNFFHLKELGFSKLFECPSFITYIKYIMFSYFFSQSCCFLYPNFNPPLHSSWRTSFSSFLESFDIVTEQNVILFYRCHTVFYCNNEDYQYTLEQLDILLLKMMRSEEALHCFPLSTPSNLVSLKLLMNFTRVILEEIKQRFRPCLEGNVIVDILHFLEFIGSKFLSSHGHCFLDTFYKIWVLAGVVMHKFKREELIEIFLHCFQFLWKRLSEGAFYSHRLCMHSIIEYACQFEKSVSDFILLSTIDSISKSARSQDRFLTFSYLVSKCSIQCLARCCSAICSGASLMELKVLKHFLQKISMDNGYCNLHDLFSQHSWCILRSWLEHEDGELLEFPFHLFDWSLGSFQHSFPAEFYLLKETDRAIFQKSSLISSNASEQELFVALLDSNLFQCSAISKNNISVHSSDKFDLLFRHILQDDFDGFLAFHLNWMRREYGLFVNAFSAFSILELRIFLSRPKIEVKVFFQLISMLDRCCCERNQADSLFSCMLLWLVILLHLNEEHLMTNELMKLMEKILNRLRDHVSVLKVEDSLLQEMFSCLLIRLNFLGLKSIGFCKIACQFLKGLPSNIMLQLEPPATLPNSLPNEAMCLYHKTLFCAYPTLEMQLDFFVRVCTRRALLGPFVVVARLQLLQEILARNREKIAETGKLEGRGLQDLQSKCTAYLVSILKDWLPFISYDDLIPFDRTDIYDIAERCLLYLFQSFMYPVGITCFESAYVFQVPSLLSFTDWSQVVETIIQISFSKFLSCEEEPSWTAAFCALCRLFNDRRTHNYMKNTSYFSSLFNQEIFHLLQARNNMTTVEDSLNSSHFEWLLKNNFRMDESLWLRQLTCCLLHNSCIDSSILIHLRELCLVSLEISVFLFPLILMEIYLSGNIDEWHRIRDGLIVTLSDRAFSSRLTVVLIESLDFVRFQCMSMNGLYADRLDQERHLDNINIFSDSSLLQAVADAAIRVKKYSTAFFYNELVLDGRCVVSHFLETADEANLYVRHKATLQNLVESALGLSDSDLVDAFPMITSSFDLFDSQHVYSLATLAERNCQYELTLRYLDQFLIATEKFSHQCEPKLQRTALSNLPSVLARCGLHYLSDCIDKNALSFSNFLCQSDCSSTKISLKNDVNVFSNAVRDLTEWSAFASETFHPQSYTSDEAFSDQPQCIIPEALRIWHLLEEVCFESSRHISQVVARLRIISYREKEEQDLFSEVERLCLYEDCVHVELDDETIRQLCVVNLERKQFAKVAIWFVKYLDFWNRGPRESTAKEGAFYDLVQLVQEFWKPSFVNFQENDDSSTNLLSCVFRLERAKLLYEKREFDSAIQGISSMLSCFAVEQLMDSSLSESKQSTSSKLLLQTYIHATLVLGRWLYETHSEPAKVIFEKYFNHAKDICMKSQLLVELRCQSFYYLASFSDQVLSTIEGYENSAERRFESSLDKQREEELEKCKELAKQNRLKRSQKDELLRHIRSLQKETDHNRAKLQATRENCEFWLKNALENYTQSLLSGHHYTLISTFRFVDLWMNNSLNREVNSYIISLLQCENSTLFLRKFKPLIYQLSGRLDMTESLFHKAVCKFIFEMAKMYPHDCIWPLLALSNGDRIPQTQKGAERFTVEVSKKDAATKILKQLFPFHSKLIKQMKEVSEAYLELSELSVDSQGEFSIKSLMLSNIRDFRFVRVPNTLNNFRHDDHQYEEEPTIVSFLEKFEIAGGINHPKVITCLGSDGKEYKQLVKGSDDLRQDAIMQQFFEISNQLLFMNQTTRSRRLFMRTYNVLPLSPCAGVVQWVEGTIPLGIYLIGTTGSERESAHCRFRPQDWSSAHCRKRLREAPGHMKSEVFNEICQNFQPVFRYFFLEYFHIPSQCLERRLAYARSVATSSIIGYLIGLGDRHCSNILLDLHSAEVVHIDFGISFEQGRLLRTPERVPFRLTRDIVDGMGSYGVEGPFRRSCESALGVLQDYKKILLTVIKVFLHDPLFRWALSPLKAFLKQSDKCSNATFLPKESTINYPNSTLHEVNAVQGNSEAARALLRIQEKLNGFLENEQVDTRTHVRRLINDAKNVESLCKMFEGWAPWV